MESSHRAPEPVAGAAIVRLHGEYDIYRRDELVAALAPLRRAAVAIIDCSEATYLDSTFLGQLAIVLREVTAGGGELRLAGVNVHIRRLLEIAGFHKVLRIYPSAADAAAGLYLLPSGGQ